MIQTVALKLNQFHLLQHATVAKNAKDKQLKKKISNKLRKMATTFGGDPYLFNFSDAFHMQAHQSK